MNHPEYFVMSCRSCLYDDDMLLEVRRYNSCFYISAAPEYLEDSPALKQEYMRFVKAERGDPVSNGGHSDGFRNLQAYYEWALTPCLKLFKDLAPDPEQKVIKLSLYDYYRPKTFQYSLHAIADKLVPVVSEKEDCVYPPGVELDISILHPSWPIYTDSEVFLDITKPSQALRPIPDMVVVRNRQGRRVRCFFKAYSWGTKRPTREIENHKKLTDANLAPDVRVCRVQGVVMDDRGRVMGLLLSYVRCEYVTLCCAVDDDTRDGLKHKWAEQIKETIGQLHGAGLVWGDAELTNVLIGNRDDGDRDAETEEAEIEDWDPENKDAWLVDFGGAYAHNPGVVDEEIEGTVERDLQGLDDIIKYVFRGPEDGTE